MELLLLIIYLYGSVRFTMKNTTKWYQLIIPFSLMLFGVYMLTPNYVGTEKIYLMIFISIFTIMLRCIIKNNIKGVKYESRNIR